MLFQNLSLNSSCLQGKREKIPGVQSIASYKSTDPVYYINCSFVHQMPVTTGNYTYSIDVSPNPADQFSKSFYIGKKIVYFS